MFSFYKKKELPTPEPSSQNSSWTEETMGVKVKSLDDQHRHLSELVQELRKAITERRGHQEALKMLINICEQARHHVVFEESILETHGYPGLIEHQEDHAVWLKDINEMRRSVENGKVSIQIATRSLELWFAKHIIEKDRQYMAFLRRKNIR